MWGWVSPECPWTSGTSAQKAERAAGHVLMDEAGSPLRERGQFTLCIKSIAISFLSSNPRILLH